MAEQTEEDNKIQTKHVLETALANLSVVIDQLDTLDDSAVDAVLGTLDNAKKELGKRLKKFD